MVGPPNENKQEKGWRNSGRGGKRRWNNDRTEKGNGANGKRL